MTTKITSYFQCFSHRYLGWKINVHNTCDKEGAESEQVTTRIRVNEDDRSDPLWSNPSIQVETRVKPSNLSFIRANDHGEPRTETSKPLLHAKHSFADPLKNDYIVSEQIILQDPYLPPPPYQKNFDYQSMQVTEPMKEIKAITDRLVYTDYSISPLPQQTKIQSGIYTNVTKSYPVPVIKLPNYSQKESYVYKPSAPASPANYPHVQAMHIHIIKHPGSPPTIDDNLQSPIQKSFVSRPYRHSMTLKKPLRKIMPYTYPLRSLNKISKPMEQQVSGSIATKSVMVPPLRNFVAKVPHTMLVSYAAGQPTKKPYFGRKREESKSQHFSTNRLVEEQMERKTFAGGFNPSSIVVESGFKPIIPNTETQNPAAQERMSENVEDYVDQGGKESTATKNNATLAEEASKNPFEGKQPVLFEPMFIPSPPIDEQLRNKKKPQDQSHKVKTRKPGQNNIVYIWPNEGVTNGPAKESYYNYYAADGVSSPPAHYNDFEMSEPSVPAQGDTDDESSDAYHTMPMPVVNTANKGPFRATNNYKVTEYEQPSDQYDNSTHVSPLTSETERKTEEATNYKIKYIPVGNSAKNPTEGGSKFAMTGENRDDGDETPVNLIKS